MDNSTAGEATDLASHAPRGFVDGAFGAVGGLFGGIMFIIEGIFTIIACFFALVIYLMGYGLFLGFAMVACLGTALLSIRILNPKLSKSRSCEKILETHGFAIAPITLLVVGIAAIGSHWYNYKYETGATWVYILYEMDLAVFALCGLVFVAAVAIKGIMELYRWASGNQGAVESDEEAAKPTEGKEDVAVDYNEKVVEEVDNGFPPVRDTTF